MSVNSCPICSQNSSKLIDPDFCNYQLYRCNNCQVVYCSPFKAPVFDFYTEADDILSKNRHYKHNPWYSDHPTQKAKILENGAGKTALDLGCGNGAYLEFVSKRGFDVVGVDLDKTSLNAAKTRNFSHKAEFFNMTLADVHEKFPDLRFDVISAFEVVEHLDNPKEVIELIHKMLKPGGHFIGTLPSFERYLIKKINMVYEVPPYHLTYWTEKTWKNALEKLFDFKHQFSTNDVFCGYMSYQMKHKVLQKNNWEESKGLAPTIVRAFFSVSFKIESAIEKITKKGGSFYFEFQKSK